MTAQVQNTSIRGIAVVDIGYTNSKVLLYDHALRLLSERKHASFHREGRYYKEIDAEAAISFARQALQELDAVQPIDKIVTSAHGACIVCLDGNGHPAVPVMDYMSEPPPGIESDYYALMPGFDECYSPPLPMALLHGMQLFWQQRVLAHDFARTRTILPLMQYVGFGLGGRAVTEVSSMSCQTHLVDMRNGEASSIARKLGWDTHYAPMAKAWEVIGTFKPDASFRGRGEILAGVHDSNANYLRYLAGGLDHFTLLSTGTWIIGFDTDADIRKLDSARDIVANKDVFGRTVACCRFFGGKELEVVSAGALPRAASLEKACQLVMRGTYALASFSDSGGPLPGTGGKGHVIGPAVESDAERASLAALYCALMVSESLEAIGSKHDIIVDGPFSQNDVFLQVLATLRPKQKLLASALTDGTATGAACLALMPDGILPKIAVPLRRIEHTDFDVLPAYQKRWRDQSLQLRNH
jgi:sugar (pentulose or hexulose) kinase